MNPADLQLPDSYGELTFNPVTSRPPIEIEVVETGWAPWIRIFKHHHYLADAGPMPFSTAFTGFDADTGEPVCFMGISGMVVSGSRVARACRLVVTPEYQGAGVGLRFLNALSQREVEGRGFIGRPVPVYMHTAAPALVAALRRSPDWRQVSQRLVGDKAGGTSHVRGKRVAPGGMKWGGHWRSVAGFRYGSLSLLSQHEQEEAR